MSWTAIKDGLLSLGDQYGVNPLIFAVIYLSTIPLFTMSVGWIVRRLLRGRSPVVPSVVASFSYVAAYLYVFIFGRNMPWWIYALLIGLMSAGSYFTFQNIRKRTARLSPQETTHDLIVVGGGAAGLTAAGLGASLGAKTLLVERRRLGGACTWTGCVPSKTLLKSAQVAQQMRQAARFGLVEQPPELDFGRLMEHVRATRQAVYEDAGRPERYEAMGVEVRRGDAHFLDPHTLEIEEEDGVHTASGRYVVIAAGGRPRIPPVEGLGAVPYLTSETLFDLDEQPRRLAVLGAGPVGTEMAQAFRRLGSEVTVIGQGARILEENDPELAALLQDRLEREGIFYLTNAEVEEAAQADGGVHLTVRTGGEERLVEADALLVAIGRRPNLEGLRLEAAGVEHTEEGIPVDRHGRTNERHIYAAGDVTGRYELTHMSSHMARVAISRALLKIPMAIDEGHVPRVTYTDPELAHVGRTERELRESGARYEVYRFPYEKLDRAVTEGAETGLIKVFATKWRGKILGASILGARAGEMICEYALAMKRGVTLRHIAGTIHPYPTYGLGVRRAADQWYARKQTPRLVRFIQRTFHYRGDVPDVDPDRIV